MKGLPSCKCTRLAAVASLLAGITILAALILSGHAEAQPTTFHHSAHNKLHRS